LAEFYEIDTQDKLIIKEYAFTNSIVEVAEKLQVNVDYVRTVITRRSSDELHRLVRSGYRFKTKHLRGNQLPYRG
jgi:hypothetical protein